MKKLTAFRSSLLFLFLIFLTSCAKQPTSDFSLDKSEYSPGESVVFTNKSNDAFKYKWTITDPAGSTTELSGKNPSYKIPLLGVDGTYFVDLKAYSRRDKKTSLSSKTFLVKTQRGDLQISRPGAAIQYTVTTGSETLGSSTSGVFYTSIPVGFYSMNATDGIQNWPFNVTIQAGKTSYIYLF